MPDEIRGEFHPIPTKTPGIEFSEHVPMLAQQTDKLAIVRSISHTDSAHGRGMYWNMTGHKPPERVDWPSLAVMVSKFHEAPKTSTRQSSKPSASLPEPRCETPSTAHSQSVIAIRCRCSECRLLKRLKYSGHGTDELLDWSIVRNHDSDPQCWNLVAFICRRVPGPARAMQIGLLRPLSSLPR